MIASTEFLVKGLDDVLGAMLYIFAAGQAKFPT
jgi:hypothetical protein